MTPEREAEILGLAVYSQTEVDELFAEIDRLRGESSSKYGCALGVGDGAGKLFVYGNYASIKAAQKIVLERDALKAEVSRLHDKYDFQLLVKERDSLKFWNDQHNKDLVRMLSERDDLTKRLETINNENEKLRQDMHLVVSDAGKDLIKERDVLKAELDDTKLKGAHAYQELHHDWVVLAAENEKFRRDYDKHDLLLENDRLKDRIEKLREACEVSCMTKMFCKVSGPCRLCRALSQDDEAEKK